MANYSGVIKVDVSWTALKSTASSKNIFIQYESTSSAYEIFCVDGTIAYSTIIFKGSVPNTINFNQTQNDLDKTDFETNYKDITTNKPAAPTVATDGYAAATSNPTLIAASDGTTIRTVRSDASGRLIIIGQGTAGTPAGGVISIQGVSGGQAVPISGSITATNASIGSTGATPPASATYIGGSVTTAVPAYTTGQMNALSLTTAGLLRIDGVYPINATTPTTDGTFIAAAVTTAAPTYTTGQMSALSLTTGGLLRIDGSGVTQPVSGTVAATQSGTWTVQPGNTANTTPWLTTISQGGNSATVSAGGALKIDGSAVTQPVSGTITANIGTTNGLALDATLAKLTISQSAALGTNTQAMVGGSVTTAAPTYTTGNINPFSLTTAGALRVDGSGVTQPISGTVTANAGTGNFNVIGTGTAGTAATGVITVQGIAGGVALPVSISGTVTTQDTTSLVDNAAFTDGTSRVMPAGFIFDETAGTALTENDVGAARLDSKRSQIVVIEDATTRGQRLTITAANAMKVDGSAVTQPVSGTVTSNIGTTNGLALDTTLAKLTITQGTALGTNTQAMVGGSVTTAAPTYTTGQISPISLTTAGAIRIDGSGVTQPISGTVTSNQGTAASLANAWSTKITDATNGPVAVKAASTAAVATDPALVVAISPNNTISVGPVTVSQSDTTGTGTLNALNTTASVTLAGTYSASMQLLAGTLVGTIVPEVSVDGGTTWVATFFDDPTTGNKVSSIVFGANNTAQTRSIMGAGGSSNIRVRVSAFTSGTATCNVRATTQNDKSLFFDGAAGSALAPTVAQVGGSVTTAAPTYTTATMNALSLTTAGALRIDGSAVTQPVSGTVTANIGTSGSLALDATLSAMSLVDNAVFTDGTTRVQPVGFIFDETAGTALTENDTAAARVDSKRAIVNVIEDGTTRGTRATVKAASTAPVATDTSLVVTMSPNSADLGIVGIIKPSYGTANQAMTITLASLTNTSSRASTAVDNTTSLYEDVNIFFKVTTAAAGVSATGYVNIYVYGTVDGGTTYPEAITGTDAAITLTAPPNLVLIGQINANTNGATKLFGPISFCRNAGFDRLPARWGVVVQNETGATFNATAGNFAVTYQGVNGQLA